MNEAVSTLEQRIADLEARHATLQAEWTVMRLAIEAMYVAHPDRPRAERLLKERLDDARKVLSEHGRDMLTHPAEGLIQRLWTWPPRAHP